MDMELNAPLLRPTTPISAHSSSITSSTYRTFKLSRSRPLSTYTHTYTHTYTSPFSHSKFPILSPQSSGSSTSSHSSSSRSSSRNFDSSCLKPSATLSRTRSLYTKFNTEVQFIKLKLTARRRKGKEGRWVKIEGEGENERRAEVFWRRIDGGQGMIPYGGVGRERLE
ncbi:hypothetical protein SBOR_1329 [Sclerotinia borealis F-4128]|uniref:Uncharacterized protein n=1 Tax=Sclerotinia borealis (strain F-4128) TaxID=1432307 RepID=W9CR69_SCLBF|nr:hypothetical protein SBOR_1329 [Sclerotinia borealis F-4128]